jgi:Sec-independent protein secretion pathway component TatC
MNNSSQLSKYIFESIYRSFYAFTSFCVCTGIGLYYNEAFLFLLMSPIKMVTTHMTFVCSTVSEGFESSLTIALMSAFFCVCPLFLYSSWCFYTPSCFEYEKKKLFWNILMFMCLTCTQLFLFYSFLLPYLWIFFKSFEMSSDILNLHMLPSINLFIVFMSKFAFFSEFVIVCFVFLHCYGIYPSFKMSLCLYTLCASFLSPPHILMQASITLFLLIFFELFIFSSILQKKLNLILKKRGCN